MVALAFQRFSGRYRRSMDVVFPAETFQAAA
jgi:hypothetical protein